MLNFTRIAPIRSNNLGGVLGDLESHLPAGHPYHHHNEVTWAQEATRGVNARIRNASEPKGQMNACYVLRDRAVVLPELPLLLSTVAALVPMSLRGPLYVRCLVQAQDFWQTKPLYVLDEWTAYVNGLEHAITGRGTPDDVLAAIEFSAYSLVLLATASQIAYKTQLSEFVAWQSERTMSLWDVSSKRGLYDNSQRAYLDQLIIADDATMLRQSIGAMLGDGWLSKVFERRDLGII